MNDPQKTRSRATKHGKNILAIFPQALEDNPYKLYQALLRLENKATKVKRNKIATDRILVRVKILLGCTYKIKSKEIFINNKPREYSLMLNDGESKRNQAELQRDADGYGILAPDF